MEFLSDYKPLSECTPRVGVPALDALLERFNDSVYCHRNRSPSFSQDWFLKHLDNKIYTKVDALSEHERLRPLLTGDGVEIAGVVYPSIQRLMADVVDPDMLAYFSPQFLSLVHGDLTFQNIMVGQDNAVKV